MAPTQLSPSALLYTPTTTDSEPTVSSRNAPKVVILTTWIFARRDHIAKYVEQYQALYPGATILVIESFLYHFLRPFTLREELTPVVPAIRGILGDGANQTGKPQLLLHVFSNSGLGTSWVLRNVYQAESPANDKGILPQHATIFDSSPGRYDYWAVVAALLYGIPSSAWLQRIAAMPLAHMLSGGIWVWCRVFGGEDWVLRYAQAANNPSRVDEVCRAYAYGRADRLVPAHWVEAHAADATVQGFNVKKMVDFGAKSAHVAHARTDPSRYWALVADTWKSAVHDTKL
ncbi:unnamed protein product [Clonostachys byssicola]|uniref:Transmembrane protein 53 n=1 Tax=Clonostachys byssicola TaxID=160290 RepID=A0A9N9UPJ4_9HYPO|nr:unnamed protein product [Clonostachys byssicola]